MATSGSSGGYSGGGTSSGTSYNNNGNSKMQVIFDIRGDVLRAILTNDTKLVQRTR
jgi:hypothetical protein